MIIHIIYHIPGRKVGCTKNLIYRMQLYLKDEGKIPDYVILEELHNKTDQEAGDIEWAWADKLDYKRGAHYTVKTGLRSFEVLSRAGKKGGRRTAELGYLSAAGKRSKGGLIGGPIGGRRRAEVLTPERRSEISSVAGKRAAELGKAGFQTISREKQVELGRKGGCSQSGICPHCGIETIVPLLHRFHLDRCSKIKIRFVRGN
jgi:hypothetical protein